MYLTCDAAECTPTMSQMYDFSSLYLTCDAAECTPTDIATVDLLAFTGQTIHYILIMLKHFHITAIPFSGSYYTILPYSFPPLLCLLTDWPYVAELTQSLQEEWRRQWPISTKLSPATPVCVPDWSWAIAGRRRPGTSSHNVCELTLLYISSIEQTGTEFLSNTLHVMLFVDFLLAAFLHLAAMHGPNGTRLCACANNYFAGGGGSLGCCARALTFLLQDAVGERDHGRAERHGTRKCVR